MELIKHKILLENSTDRNDNSPTYGVMTATSFYINVFLTQNMDDMGLFTDSDYISFNGNQIDNQILVDKLVSDGHFYAFMSGGTQINPLTTYNIGDSNEKYYIKPLEVNENYYFTTDNSRISGYTDSKLEDVKSYNRLNPYIAGFDINKEQYISFSGDIIDGVNRVHEVSEPIIYVFDANNDPFIGTNNQKGGIRYMDYTGKTRTIVDNDGNFITIPMTSFDYMGEGWNETNTSVSSLIKEEYLFGIISPPEIEQDIFIDRGKTTVFEKHLRLSEIKTLDALVKYNGGYYNVTRY